MEPLTLAQFLDRLRVTAFHLDAPDEVTIARTARGEVITGRRGARLWAGQFTLAPGYHQTGREVRALLGQASSVGATVLLTDPAYRGVAAAGVTVQAVASNNRTVTLEGLPPGYRLAAGDYLSWVYSGRYAFHQTTAAAVANSQGRLTVELTPHIRPGAVGAVVELERPVFRAILTGRTTGRYVPVIAEAATFDFIQTLR